MNRGVLLIALGHSMYGQLAANLAASLKCNSPELPIHLVWADDALSHLTEEKKALFDSMAECPSECYHHENGKLSYIKAKVCMYELSPFEETIFLDVDTIVCPKKKFTELYTVLGGYDFTMENRSRVNLLKNSPNSTYLWGDIEDIKKAYDFKGGWLYGLHSEFIYFKKNKVVKTFFKTVKSVFAKPKFEVKEFNGDLPDEFAFAIAMIKHDMYPHVCPYIPIYWQLTDSNKGTSLGYVIDNYYAYSVGGNNTPVGVRRKYMQLARSYFNRLGVRYPYDLKPKKTVLAARRLM